MPYRPETRTAGNGCSLMSATTIRTHDSILWVWISGIAKRSRNRINRSVTAAPSPPPHLFQSGVPAEIIPAVYRQENVQPSPAPFTPDPFFVRLISTGFFGTLTQWRI